jgi:PAS domain S-box-containing protein
MGERQLVRRDGSFLPTLLYTATEVDASGKVTGTLAMFADITERKRTEEQLTESEERFRLAFENANIGLCIVSVQSRFLRVNDQICAIWGYSRSELEGMTVNDITHPEDRDISPRFIELALSGEINRAEFEKRYIHKHGHVVWGKVAISLVTDQRRNPLYFISHVQDITAAKEAEEDQRRLATALEQAAEGVIITDTKGIIQYVNPAVERITGFCSEELLGKTPAVFKSGEHDAAFYRQLWDTIKAGNTWLGRLVNKRKDGSLFHEDATISPVRNASGEITNFVAVKRDITEHLELSKQLFQAQKMEAVGTLAGGVAHDFNNILQVVLGYSELILSEEHLPERYRDDLEKVNRAARNGADLVGRLLTFSRKSEIKPLSINLNRRIEQLQKMLSRTIPKMIEIELILADNLSSVHADPTQVDQILMNLAVNARDAMPEGGRLTIRTENVILEEDYCRAHLGAKPGHYVLLSVSDTGKGMDNETMQHIFEPFFTTKSPGEGTGLGLAMVYGIVKQHGGHIMCYSEPSEGTIFKVYFPALISPAELPETETRALPQGGSETILIVDDEELIRDLGARILTRAGYKVLVAANGKKALEIYQARSDEISLVILDLIMPEMGGKQCLEALLTLDPAAKVVIASGYHANDATREALTFGAKGFINKPYDIPQVLAVLRSVLDRKTESNDSAD